MLYYIREYPQQVHHPKEDRYLSTPLRDRTDEYAPRFEYASSEATTAFAMTDTGLAVFSRCHAGVLAGDRPHGVSPESSPS
ncbi:hypothetical protein [Paraburkholderia aromaticivorans]|uniref:hypothetical protein n=1 Tax=Paraburkholderia aromaticivorans TaxID=2026199 RepID=UPI001F0D154A|nr:hypothetical protein [Paraburkholderia aromaticivorans]